jgi:4-amino-4-deoxy-L-arabinose transferase-like glycosyltransferase
VVLGTYRLAHHFTAFPVLAAAITLCSPGFLVSSTTVMCDVTMLALWIVATLLWLVGLQSQNHLYLIAAAILIAAGALTKYFGVALIPLLFFYTLHKQRRLGASLFYLFIPALALAAYQYWTHGLYGRGLLSDALQYASLHDRANGPSIAAKSMVGLAFAGGCAIPALFLAPLLWTRKWLVVGLLSCGFAGLAVTLGWVHIEAPLVALAAGLNSTCGFHCRRNFGHGSRLRGNLASQRSGNRFVGAVGGGNIGLRHFRELDH